MRTKQASIPQMASTLHSTTTPAMALLTLTWEQGMKDSWGRINTAMRSALRLAIGGGLPFRASDFADIYSKFRAHYWISAEPEWIYSQAVTDGNKSAFTAWEEHNGRKPFFANEVTAYSYGSFIHANSINRDRERLAVGFGFQMEDRRWYCTGFSNGCVRIALYQDDRRDGKPVKLRKLTHKEMSALCPSKARKAPSAEPEEPSMDSASE